MYFKQGKKGIPNLLIYKTLLQTSVKEAELTESDLIKHNSSVTSLHEDIDNESRTGRHHRLFNMSWMKSMPKGPMKYSFVDEVAKVVFLAIFIMFNGFYWWYFLYVVT